MNRPNLFEFATSELSQDAVLCWLLSWANPRVSDIDPPLHRLGRDLLATLFVKHNRTLPTEISTFEMKRQHKNIDILVVLNGDLGVVIEDKIHSSEHSNQLSRYIEQLRQEGFKRDNLIPVFVQSGDQSSYAQVRAAGFSPLARGELIHLIKDSYAEAKPNAIVADFLQHLESIEEKVQGFASLPLPLWDHFAWVGFYKILQEILGEGEWGYVANPAGGFMGFWWHFRGDRYLQLEQDRLCFKISVDTVPDRSQRVAAWGNAILAAAAELNVPVVRLRRVRPAKTTTVAITKGDYRVAKADKLMNLDDTVRGLRSAEKVIALAVEKGGA